MPKFDKGLWQNICKQGRDADCKIQQVQDRVIKGLHATLSVADKILALQKKGPEDEDVRELEELVKESIYLQGNNS